MPRPGGPAVVIRLHPADDVAIAMEAIEAGRTVEPGVSARGAVAPGHKIALRAVGVGELVRKSGHCIGVATAPIAPGDHVHTHNLGNISPATPVGSAHGATGPVAGLVVGPGEQAGATATTFDGFHRADGRVGTRNHLLVLPSVNCSATVARAIAERARPHLPDGVDGVWALAHQSGCGIPDHGPQLARLRAVLRGYATHPNTAGVLVVGLGCEVNQVADLVAGLPPERLRVVGMQDAGGTAAAIASGAAAVDELARLAMHDRRAPAPLSQLVVGLQCGGSDGFSAISANPALGAAADLLVAAGGTVLL